MTRQGSSWEHYATTLLEFQSSYIGRVDLRLGLTPSRIARLASVGLSHGFAVLTPCNPRGAQVSDDLNGKRVEDLQRELVQHARLFIRVDGLSPDRKRREEGFGVALELAKAIEVARAWEQEALFWFDGHAFWLVPVLSDGRAVRLPAGGRALKAASRPRDATGAVFDLDAGPQARPQATRLVGMVSWSWGPAHSRTGVYRLSRDRDRSRWILWDSPQELQNEESEGDYPRAYCPTGNRSAKEAALMLLGFTWQRERDLCDVPDPPHEVQGGALVSAVEIVALAQQVLGERAE